MPQTEMFTCPCCGQRAPQDRLEEGVGPFLPLEAFMHIFGGKEKLTEEDREARKGMGFQRGSGRGRMRYDFLEVSDELRENYASRIQELAAEL